MDVIKLWQLPDVFFHLKTAEEQFDAIQAVTHRVNPGHISKRRDPCKLTLYDDMLAVTFFLVTLGFPILLSLTFLACVVQTMRQKVEMNFLLKFIVLILVLSLHPIPKKYSDWRRTPLTLALLRYFTFEVIIDRSNPLLKDVGTIKVTAPFREDSDESYNILKKYPLVCLACPHGVFNYGAILWCCISYWIIGREQYTGAANAVKYVPGLRYMNPLIWAINADRSSIKKTLQKPLFREKDTMNRGAGMLGMVPDGILGAFRCREGIDELIIGKRRGLMRICQEEGAIVFAAWFFGTTDMLTVATDPFGIMEFISRKIQAGILLFYGRWFMPIPKRIPVTLCTDTYQCEKMASPTAEQVENVHQEVYGRLQNVYEKQKSIVGYSDRTLQIL